MHIISSITTTLIKIRTYMDSTNTLPRFKTSGKGTQLNVEKKIQDLI